MILRYILLFPVWVSCKVLNYPLSPMVVLFANDSGWLPAWLWWFQTPDNPLDGDSGWRTEHRPFKLEDAGWKRWANRTGWLWRNSMYGFKQSVLGVHRSFGDSLEVIGDERTSDKPIGHSGVVMRYIGNGGKRTSFQYYRVMQWGNTGRCLRINIGWKLWDFTKQRQYYYVFSVNPLMGFHTRGD